MNQARETASRNREWTWVRGGVLLAFLGVAMVWGMGHWSAEARVRRATARVVALVEKTEAESAVSLGLAANRLGGQLEPGASLEVEGHGMLVSSRQEIVQLFAQIRDSLATLTIAGPTIETARLGRDEVEARVAGRYRLATGAGEVAEGDGAATLIWIRGEEGWRISRVALRLAEGDRLLRELK